MERGELVLTQAYQPEEIIEKWRRYHFVGVSQRSSISTGVTKLLVSNLHCGISDADIKELFQDIGPLQKAAVNNDNSGRSLGTADVVFERRADALEAIKKYNNVPLDGRPINIQVASSWTPGSGRGRGSISWTSFFSRGSRGGRIGYGGIRGGRIGYGGSRGGRVGCVDQSRKVPTAEELDAELDAYVNEMK